MAPIAPRSGQDRSTAVNVGQVRTFQKQNPRKLTIIPRPLNPEKVTTLPPHSFDHTHPRYSLAQNIKSSSAYLFNIFGTFELRLLYLSLTILCAPLRSAQRIARDVLVLQIRQYFWIQYVSGSKYCETLHPDSKGGFRIKGDKPWVIPFRILCLNLNIF